MELMFSPANAEAAQLYKDNTKEYERRVKVSCLCLSAQV
jgi:ubiquitin-protein ligase